MKLKLPGHEVEIDENDKKFLSKIAGNDAFGIAGDFFREWRWRNAVKMVQRVRKTCEDNGLNPKNVAPKFLHEFFEGASLEEDETLQQMWENLLINESTGIPVNIFYINLLKELESSEAKILNFLYSNSKEDKYITFDGNRVLENIHGISEDQFDVFVEKLYGFRLLKPGKMTGISVGNGISPALDTTRVFVFTELGLDFCRSCSNKNKAY